MHSNNIGRLTGWLALGLVVGTGAMGVIDLPLRGEAAPFGIVSFELVGTPAGAVSILRQWQQSAALDFARLSLLADFAYLVLYGAFFTALCAWVGEFTGEQRWRAWAVRAATLAPVFDAVENVFLLIQVQTLDSATPWPQLAAGFAATKFALLAACLLYVLVAAKRYIVDS